MNKHLLAEVLRRWLDPNSSDNGTKLLNEEIQVSSMVHDVGRVHHRSEFTVSTYLDGRRIAVYDVIVKVAD